MDTPWDRQRAFNRASRSQWDGFGPHRDRVSSLIASGGRSNAPGRLCVLGAGNANDLDLHRLLAAQHEVHLVDLDAEALAEGVDRQGVAGHPGLRLHGGVDLTGVLSTLADWGPLSAVGLTDLRALADWPAGRVAAALPGPFDRVASTCLLSQLIGNARHSIGENHPAFMKVVGALRLGHLRLLVGLTAPGGGAVLVTDATSTDVVPALASWPEASLAGRLPGLARDRSLFHGADPAVIRGLFREDHALTTQVDRLETVPPWRWRLHDRTYLVWALRIGVRPNLRLSLGNGFL